jgi:hypothetical protein
MGMGFDSIVAPDITMSCVARPALSVVFVVIVRALPNLALLAASLAAGCLLAEAGLRLVYESPSRAIHHHQLFCEYDPLLGWRKTPGATGRHVAREYAVTERMNSKGLRGPEYAYRKQPQTVRILVLGDSFAEGHTVELEEVFSQVLERELQARTGRPFEVINSGTAGWSTDQELLFFETEGVKYDPDVTLLLFHDNDVWFNHQHRYWRAEKPLFVLENGALRLTNVPTPPSTPHPPPGVLGATPPTGRLAAAKEWVVRHSYLCELIRDRIRFSPALRRITVGLGLAGARPGAAASRPIPPDEWQVYFTRPPAEVAGAWAMTAALIDRIARGAASAGSAFVVFYVPPAEYFHADRLAARLEAYSIPPEKWDQGLVLAHLSAICVRLGIDLVPPGHFAAAVTDAERAGDPRFYFEIDGHWNRAGHRAGGLVLADHLAPRFAPLPAAQGR